MGGKKKVKFYHISYIGAGGFAAAAILQGIGIMQHHHTANFLENMPSYKMAHVKYVAAQGVQTKIADVAKSDAFWTVPQVEAQTRALYDQKVWQEKSGQQFMPRANYDEVTKLIANEREERAKSAGNFLTDLVFAVGIGGLARKLRREDSK